MTIKSPSEESRELSKEDREMLELGVAGTSQGREVLRHLDEALAEVERLRRIIEHDHVPMPGMPDVTVPRQMLEQGRVTLVAPDAEIERLREAVVAADVDRVAEHAEADRLRAELAAAKALLTSNGYRAHLAGQTAAPETRCPTHGARLADTAHFECGCQTSAGATTR